MPGKRGERADRRVVPIRRHGDEMFRGPAINPGGVRMETFEGVGRGARLGRGTTAMAFHERLLYTFRQPPGTGMRMSGNLLNGITPCQRRVTNDDAANPRPTLTNGLQRTSGGSGSVPGGPPLYAR